MAKAEQVVIHGDHSLTQRNTRARAVLEKLHQAGIVSGRRIDTDWVRNAAWAFSRGLSTPKRPVDRSVCEAYLESFLGQDVSIADLERWARNAAANIHTFRNGAVPHQPGRDSDIPEVRAVFTVQPVPELDESKATSPWPLYFQIETGPYYGEKLPVSLDMLQVRKALRRLGVSYKRLQDQPGRHHELYGMEGVLAFSVRDGRVQPRRVLSTKAQQSRNSKLLKQKRDDITARIAATRTA